MAENLSRYHPAGGQRAYAIVDDTMETGRVPDFEAFMLKITDFINKVEGALSKPSKVFNTTFQGQAEEQPDKEPVRGLRQCKAYGTKGHRVDNCYTL